MQHLLRKNSTVPIKLLDKQIELIVWFHTMWATESCLNAHANNHFFYKGAIMKILSLVSAVLASVATQAAAADPVYFKAPINFAGTGCPAGSIAVTGENSPTLTIMFDKYDAAKPNSKARSGLERAACSFAVPVHVPGGWQVSVMTADWMGFSQGSTELSRRYFFAGQPMPPKNTNPSGNFVERDDLIAGSVTSNCGEDVTMRINSSVMAKSNNSYIALDSLDLVHRKVIFHMTWKQCQK